MGSTSLLQNDFTAHGKGEGAPAKILGTAPAQRMSLEGGVNEVEWGGIVQKLDRVGCYLTLAELRHVRRLCDGSPQKALSELTSFAN